MKSISVIVSTRNRPDKINDCLKSILANSFSDFEVVVVDQSDDYRTKEVIQEILSPLIRYFRMKEKGLSKGRNLGIKRAGGKIIAFIDDDCLVNKDWLKSIYKSFPKNKDIAGVFGKVLPYKPHLHKGQICPCVFLKYKEKIITKPTLHWKNIGFGNNMAFKRGIFEKVGNFKEWLGVGSVGLSAEDAEFVLRLLLNHYKILYKPEIKVYHNRWLTKREHRRQRLSYSCGEVACYGYFAFQGNKLGEKIIKNNFLNSWGKLKFSFKSLLFFKKDSLRLLCCTLQEFYFRLRGLVVAFWFHS